MPVELGSVILGTTSCVGGAIGNLLPQFAQNFETVGFTWLQLGHLGT